jgi:uncharacterized protein (TIGR00369 family)
VSGDVNEELRNEIAGALDGLQDWQLEAVARLVRTIDPAIGYGVPPYVLGFRKLDYADGRVTGEAAITEIHLNPHSVAHGMVTFGLLDNAFGQCVHNATGKPCIAVEVKVQYLKAVRPGTVRVDASLVRAGRRIAGVEGRIIDDEGEVAVLGTATYYLLSP